jgi:hypothetical protein
MKSVALFVLVASLAGCGGVRQFQARSVVWMDDDRRAYSPAPPRRYEPYMWDAMDQMIFRPASEVWTFEPDHRAINVNALDEVPNSSWFTNRISRREMTPEEITRAGCESQETYVPAPWRIFGGKPDGASAGFLFEDANGVRYVLKVDRPQQREQATAAHAIVAAVYHAAGYYVPCNRVIGFTPDMLVLADDAEVDRTYGPDEPMTWEHVRSVLSAANRMPDGSLRGVVSRFIDGEHLGPWSYMGTYGEDPNDVVPHEHRRDLRGMFVLNAWVNHWDARDHNTFATWVEPRQEGVGFVLHYLIDFDDSLGLVEGNDGTARRFGHSQWLDIQHMAEDTFGLGLVQRPWDSRDLPTAHEIFGFYEVEGFEPDQWRPNYWNGAFERHTEGDAAWMARIIARFDLEDIRALARLGRFSELETENQLVRILAGRRRAILERYLTRLSPLADPVVRRTNEGTEACVRDLAVDTHLREARDRRYAVRAWISESARETSQPRSYMRDGRICIALPSSAPNGYMIADITAASFEERTAPLRMHFAFGRDGVRLVGLERPDGDAPPI